MISNIWRLLPSRRTVSRLVVVVLFTLSGAVCGAESEWELAVNDTDVDVVVHTRKLPSGYTEFRGITHVNSTLSACVALLRDVDSMPEWVDRTLNVEVIERISPTQVYAYTINETPWPFLDRDAIVLSTLEQDPTTLTVTIKGEAHPDFRPRNEAYVRMEVVESFWQCRPTGGGIVEITFQGYGDPGGQLSSAGMLWLMGLVVWESPYNTLKALRQMLPRDEYQKIRLKSIREPGE